MFDSVATCFQGIAACSRHACDLALCVGEKGEVAEEDKEESCC